MLEPVVVNPDTVSNQQSMNRGIRLLRKKGRAPNRDMTIQPREQITKPSPMPIEPRERVRARIPPRARQTRMTGMKAAMVSGS